MTKYIIGIDPGSEESGFCVIDSDYGILTANKVTNDELLSTISNLIVNGDQEAPIEYDIAIESIQSYGMTMGKSTIETCYMIGRLIERCSRLGLQIFLYPRPQYGKAICGGNKVNDALIRSALENRFGSYDKGKPEKKLKNGTVKQCAIPDGALFKLSGASDKRSAFAVACYHLDISNEVKKDV